MIQQKTKEPVSEQRKNRENKEQKERNSGIKELKYFQINLQSLSCPRGLHLMVKVIWHLLE